MEDKNMENGVDNQNEAIPQNDAHLMEIRQENQKNEENKQKLEQMNKNLTNPKRKISYIAFVNMIYFFMMVLLCLARLVVTFGWLPLDELALEVAFSSFVQIGVFGLLPITLISKYKNQGYKQTLSEFKFNKISTKHIIMSFSLGVLVMILNLCIASLFSALLALVGYETTSSGMSIDPNFNNFIIVVLYSAVLPAIFEEVAHRGMLLNAYKKYGILRAMLISGLMFGLMHLNIGQFFYASIIGILLAFVVVMSDSIIPAIIVHFTNNFLNTYFDFATYNNWPGAGVFDAINAFRYNNSPIIVFVVSLMVITAVLTGIAYILKKFFTERKVYAIRDRLRMKVLEEYYLSNWAKGNEVPLLNNEQLDDMIIGMQQDWMQLLAELGPREKQEFNIEFLNDTDVEENKPTLKQNIFFYGALVLSILITIFTLIWGLL